MIRQPREPRHSANSRRSTSRSSSSSRGSAGGFSSCASRTWRRCLPPRCLPAHFCGGELGAPAIVGITAFTWSGMVFAGFVGAATGRRRVLFTTRSMALLATVSVPATLLFDVWTAFGDWLFIAGPHGRSLVTVYAFQIPFTLIHLASSLVFVPLFGSIFAWLSPVPEYAPAPEPSEGQP